MLKVYFNSYIAYIYSLLLKINKIHTETAKNHKIHKATRYAFKLISDVRNASLFVAKIIAKHIGIKIPHKVYIIRRRMDTPNRLLKLFTASHKWT